MYQLIALDMDGTLLDDQKQILPSSVEAIRKAHKAGKIVCLSTGRGLAELADYKDLFPYLSYGILISGACLYDFVNQQVIHEMPLKEKEIKAIIDAVNNRDIMPQLLTKERSIASASHIRHIEDYHMAVYRNMYERVCDFVDEPLQEALTLSDVYKINLYHTNTQEREETYQRLKDLPLSFAYAEETLLEISPLHVTKALGLKTLCERLSLPLSQTIAVGDAPNDLEVLKTAGLSVAMGNSRPDVLEICDLVTDDNNHDGIAHVIETYLL